jgi:hypothetical protein
MPSAQLGCLTGSGGKYALRPVAADRPKQGLELVTPTANQGAAANEIYAEMGISGGRRKYRLGLVSFALAAAIAYGRFYSEICSSCGDCVPLTRVFVNG